MFSYFVVTEEESDEILILLSKKINSLIVLEQSIDRDSQSISQNWLAIWREGMTCIRQCLVEIILYMTYLKLDSLILSKKSDQFPGGIFQSDFFTKAQDIIQNYVLSEKKIHGVSLINSEIDELTLEFFNFLYNYQDGYGQNLTNSLQPTMHPALLSQNNSTLLELD